MKLKPLGDRFIVQAIQEDEVRESGIIIPDAAKEKPQKGRVLAVGSGHLIASTGERVPLEVEVGDEVLYSKYGGTELPKVDDDGGLLVLREADVLGVVVG